MAASMRRCSRSDGVQASALFGTYAQGPLPALLIVAPISVRIGRHKAIRPVLVLTVIAALRTESADTDRRFCAWATREHDRRRSPGSGRSSLAGSVLVLEVPDAQLSGTVDSRPSWEQGSCRRARGNPLGEQSTSARDGRSEP